jgi:hypothetical protein
MINSYYQKLVFGNRLENLEPYPKRLHFTCLEMLVSGPDDSTPPDYLCDRNGLKPAHLPNQLILRWFFFSFPANILRRFIETFDRKLIFQGNQNAMEGPNGYLIGIRIFVKLFRPL